MGDRSPFCKTSNFAACGSPQPVHSLDDVRTVVSALLRCSVYTDADPTDSMVRAGLALLNIRMFLPKQPEDETDQNISLD